MSSIYFEQIDLSYFTTNAAIGGNTGGREFTFNAGSSNVAAGFWIRSLTFWVDGNCMRGCEMWLNKAGGATQLGIIGQKAGNQSDTFVFGDGERLTSLKLWGNGYRGGRFSAVEWTTSENRTFKFGHLTSTPTYQPDIGSGFLVGLFGRHAADIDCLGFAVLRRIKNTRLYSIWCIRTYKQCKYTLHLSPLKQSGMTTPMEQLSKNSPFREKCKYGRHQSGR